MIGKTVKYIHLSKKQQELDFRRKLEGALFPVLNQKKKALILAQSGLQIKFIKLNKSAKKIDTERLVALFRHYMNS